MTRTMFRAKVHRIRVTECDVAYEGSLLMTRFRLPQRETLYEIAGRVVWTHRKGDQPAQTSGMGISFSDPASGAVLAEEIGAMLVERGTREPSGP